MTAYRSLLFVPALRPDRFGTAERSGADVMCIDLEDAVPPAQRGTARPLVVAHLAAPRTEGGARRFVRISSPRTLDGLQDLLALSHTGCLPDGIVIPKIASPQEVGWIVDLLGRGRPPAILPLIESPEALAQVEAIAGAPQVTALAFGFVDYAAATGVEMSWDALLYPRSRIAAAAAACGLPALDGTELDLGDEDALRAAARGAARLGFSGKLAVHPRQLGPIHEAFTPRPEAIARARRIVEAFERTPSGVLVLDGQLVDEPVVKVARRLLAAAPRDAGGSGTR